jgi:hypothetical protein
MPNYHYTLGITVVLILRDGYIRRAHAMMHGHERKAVWFSSRSTWEPTATKLLAPDLNGRPDRSRARRCTMAEMLEAGGTLARLSVPDEVARHTWQTHRQRSGIDPRIADALEAAARADGADPADWRVSYHDVPISKILDVEWSDDAVEWQSAGEPCGDEITWDPVFRARLRAALARRTATMSRGRKPHF